MKKFSAIAMVWLGCALCWAVLAATVSSRTQDSGSQYQEGVNRLWGPEAWQHFPTARLITAAPVLPPAPAYNPVDLDSATRPPAEGSDGRTSWDASPPPPPIPVETQTQASPNAPQTLRLSMSNISVELDLEHRKRGLMWFPTYSTSFVGVYEWSAPESPLSGSRIAFEFPIGDAGNTFDGFSVTQDGEPVDVRTEGGVARWQGDAANSLRFRISYRSRGVSAWHYVLTDGAGEVEGFRLAIRIDDPNVDFPIGSLSPTEHQADGESWQGEWRFDHLISADQIGVQLPQRLNPGPLAAKITFFAPLSLLFFFFVVALVSGVRGRELHPMHYFFLGCSFFSFHLLFAYLVDHLALFLAFGFASVVSLALTISYARLFVGLRFAIRVLGSAQMVYLVLFSASFFLDGLTGLTVTVGAVITLFIMMQLTGRTDWASRDAERLEKQKANGFVSRQGGQRASHPMGHGMAPLGRNPHVAAASSPLPGVVQTAPMATNPAVPGPSESQPGASGPHAPEEGERPSTF